MSKSQIRAALDAATRYLAAGELARAERVCRDILKDRHDEPEALRILGETLLKAGRADEAVTALRAAVDRKRSSALYRHRLAGALFRASQPEEAEKVCREAVELEPGFVPARARLGSILTLMQKFEDAIPYLRQSLVGSPEDLPITLMNLGACLLSTGKTDEAIDVFRRGIALSPANAILHRNLAIALARQGQLDEAIEHLRNTIARANQWTELHGQLLFYLTHTIDDPVELLKEHLRVCEPLNRVPVTPHANDRSPHRRLRIGYLSSDLRQHAVGFFIEPILAHHDPEQFEIFCYADHLSQDDVAQRLKSRAHSWRNTYRESDERLLEMIREDRIDILIDLGLHSGARFRQRLLASKPAPVQVAYLGYAGTTGIAAMDWRITDSHIDPPDADAFSSERLMRLPHTQWVYQPSLSAPAVNDLPALRNRFVTFGSVNKREKITANTLDRWAKVLLALPSARMHLKAEGLDESLSRQRLIEGFSSRGVSAGRLNFSAPVDFEQYMRYFHDVDIMLDTYPFAGGTTSCHALWMGVPVVTLAGRTPVSRVGASLANNVGLPQLVATSPQQFVDVALQLAGDLSELSRIRAGLREQMSRSSLCDARQFTRDFEAGLRQMWRDWCTEPI